MKREKYDVVIIGAGPGGHAVAESQIAAEPAICRRDYPSQGDHDQACDNA